MRQYSAILVDPPWDYRVHRENEGLNPSKTSQMKGTKRGIAARHYETMSMPDAPVRDLAAKDSALFMWATMPCLQEAFNLMRAWGFTYRTVGFTWVKLRADGKPVNNGLGHYTRSNAELCLLGTRGHPTRIARDVPQIIMARRREHSRKPDEQYERIMRLFAGPYLEMFARQAWPGWETWGNQIGLYPAQPFLMGEYAG